jgi:hypothetical protein
VSVTSGHDRMSTTAVSDDGSQGFARLDDVHSGDGATGARELHGDGDGASDTSGGAGHNGDATVQRPCVSSVQHVRIASGLHEPRAGPCAAAANRAQVAAVESSGALIHLISWLGNAAKLLLGFACAHRCLPYGRRLALVGVQPPALPWAPTGTPVVSSAKPWLSGSRRGQRERHAGPCSGFSMVAT